MPAKEMSGVPCVRLARSMVGTWAVGHAEGIRQTLVRTRCQASHGFGWPEAWSVPGPLDTRRDLETRMSERDVLLTTGSVGQKPGRHLDHWVRGGIKTNAGPKDMCGFPRSRLAGSLVGTWAIRNAEGLRKRPVAVHFHSHECQSRVQCPTPLRCIHTHWLQGDWS